MSQSLRRFLRQLAEAGDTGLAVSAVPSGCARLLADLHTCGAVFSRPAGRGSVVQIANRAAFSLFVESRFPLGLAHSPQDAVDRTTGVRLFADAKAARRGAFEGVFVRSVVPGTRLLSDDGVELPVADLTNAGGGAAIVLGGSRGWSFRGVVAVIENAEAFWQHEHVLPEVDLALFACGRLSERVLSWLCSDQLSGCRFIHWGDYDPVGCVEYLRLRARCGRRATLHVPLSIAELLPLHGKRELILDQVDDLDALRRSEHDQTVVDLLRLFDQHRKGLEQEALLMDLDPRPR